MQNTQQKTNQSPVRWTTWLLIIGLILLMTVPRLTALNQYIIVDEADRWRWAEDFVRALSQGDLSATLVGDGYPGIVPVWAETIWIYGEAVRRSWAEGQWIGSVGLANIFHEWDRSAFLAHQRLPIVLLNTAVALSIVWAVWGLFGRRVAFVSGILIALDPFYLSDSRVNRAEAVITGLMTLSMLFLIYYHQRRKWRFLVFSGLFGGLSLLTKIQALAISPAIALTGILTQTRDQVESEQKLLSVATFRSIIVYGLIWIAVACLTWLVLWPSMWVVPLETLTLVYNYTTRKVGAEGVSLFFLGQTYQDTGPGFLFYPVVFLLRITPLALLGLIGAIIAGVRGWRLRLLKWRNTLTDNPFNVEGTAILVIYVVIYTLAMSFGSHKQDRYLLPVFLSLDILAAMGLVYLWVWGQSIWQNIRQSKTTLDFATSYTEFGLLIGLAALQLFTVLPHHPYYYSYFNPLFGGGQTAVQTLRVGWGEGMDQVGRYLAAKPDSENLSVATRFTHNLIDYRGDLISLTNSGRWTQADYVVMYIQQVQRRLDPSPGFIDYFQAREPERVITLGDIDYAWIYPIPFTINAHPQISRVPDQLALLGYQWEDEATLRLVWENLGAAEPPSLQARLSNQAAQTAWLSCTPAVGFETHAQTPGRYAESICQMPLADLSPDRYNVEFGLASAGETQPILFPEAQLAATLSADGQMQDTPKIERLQALVEAAIPPEAHLLNRIYQERINLAAYRLDPAQPQPGDTVNLTLYWQPLRIVPEELFNLTVQLADSRAIELGRTDQVLRDAETDPPTAWLPGQIVTTEHQFELSDELENLLAGQIEVTVVDEAEVALRATTLEGELLDNVVGRFTIASDVWPTAENVVDTPDAQWQNGAQLTSYSLSADQASPGDTLTIDLVWTTTQPLAENYVAFIHLVDESGQIVAQHDSLPRTGAYPTPWWQPNDLILDPHLLQLPADLPAGTYQLLVGLYDPEGGANAPLGDGGVRFELGEIGVR